MRRRFCAFHRPRLLFLCLFSTSPLCLLSLTGWQQALTLDSLPTQQREGRRICVCKCVPGCVYIYIPYICVRSAACARVVCVFAASGENIQPKIKTHLSASSGCVCTCACICAAIFCACVYVSLCYSVWSCACDREGGSLQWTVTNGAEGGEEGRSRALHVEKNQVFKADIKSWD